MRGYYDKEGRPIGLVEFSDLFKDAAYRRIDRTQIENTEISTVWLGIDHNFNPDGPPIIFETMIFGGEYDDYQERYSTEEEARLGHQRAVNMIEVESEEQRH